MFFTYCKETGCVLVKSDEHPSVVFNLANNFDEHFSIIERDVDRNEMYGKLLKVQNDQIVVVGPYNEETMSQMCGDCPSPIQ